MIQPQTQLQPQPKKSDLGVRTASAVVMVAVAGTALWLGGLVWAAFASIIAGGVLYEWSRLVLAFVKTFAARTIWLAGGVTYIGIALAALLILRSEPLGIALVLTLLAVVIAIDVGAYFVGRTLRGPKIAPAISPSKTWSGLVGGMLGAVAVLIIVEGFDVVGFDERLLLAGPLAAVVAQTGDFFESWMKRRAGVKDSGNLIPGHGGLFDRVDGLLAVCFVGGVCMVLDHV